MTALKKYRKLESRGLWRDLPETQKREVVVNLGDASLVLSDPRSDVALTHWSLPAIHRINPGQRPAVFSPAEDATEVLELDDADMISALETVAAAIASGRARPGRLRLAILAGLLSAVVGVAVLVMPGALVRHTAGVLPPATRDQIGGLVLTDLARLTGAPCNSPGGVQALARLALRVFGPTATPGLVVVRDGVEGALSLPGNRIVLSQALIAIPDGPDVAAGHALASSLRATLADPMLPLLRHAGTFATFGLLTTGRLGPGAIRGHAERLLATPKPLLPDEPLLDRFRLAEVPSSPYAYALDPTGETVLSLIEADPWPNGPPRPLLTDEDWLRLQDICTE
ncbi:MAG: hypothetical protein ACT4OK_01895 [Gemmobacter sp.]